MKLKNSDIEARTDNGRFGAMAALAPQQQQCKLESYYPAETLVKPPLRQAAGTLHAMADSVPKGQNLTKRTIFHKVISKKFALYSVQSLRN